jgi:hypothetical protein
MKIVADWIKAIRQGYKTMPFEHLKKHQKIVGELIKKADKTLNTNLAPAIKNQWKEVRPRLLSLQRNLEKRRKLQETI